MFPIGNPQNGASHCSARAETNVCERKYTGCHKTVKETYEKGALKLWTVHKGCGKCSFNNAGMFITESACERQDLLQHADCLTLHANCLTNEGVRMPQPTGRCTSTMWASAYCPPLKCGFRRSQDLITVERCYECEGDQCNLGARRATHHAVSLALFGVFLSLLLRKCRA